MSFTTKWNGTNTYQVFGSNISHMCSSKHFEEPEFIRLMKALDEGHQMHRKLWEFVSIAKLIEEHHTDPINKTAIGFGVGKEPLVSLFAKWGYNVLATDQPPGGTSVNWETSNQHADSLEDVFKINIINREAFDSKVTFKHIDMTALPENIGKYDTIWSSCVVEHLGGFEKTKEFLLNSYKMLNPGGISVHTTEIELTEKPIMMDYGHSAVFRTLELLNIKNQLNASGAEIEMSFYTPNADEFDNYVSIPPYDSTKPHLKLLLGESITTSFMIVIKKPL
jgi:hypothetical protein